MDYNEMIFGLPNGTDINLAWTFPLENRSSLTFFSFTIPLLSSKIKELLGKSKMSLFDMYVTVFETAPKVCNLLGGWVISHVNKYFHTS